MTEEIAATFDDRSLLERVARAGMTDAEILCEETVSRDLGDKGVEALMKLWLRFKGFGLGNALVERQCAIRALARLGTPAAKREISRILHAETGEPVPDNLLPDVLAAARHVEIAVETGELLRWAADERPEIRESAFALARRAKRSDSLLLDGMTDPDPGARRAALVSAGMRGIERARPGLLLQLELDPDAALVDAIAQIANDDIVTILARLPERRPDLGPAVREALSEIADSGMDGLDIPRLQRILSRLAEPLSPLHSPRGDWR